MNEPNQSLVRSESANDDPQWLMRRATDVAGICKEIVTKTVKVISGKKFPQVEAWQSIATTYGCVLSARDVEWIERGPNCPVAGYRAIGEVKRLSDMVTIATGEGFVGEDEPIWFGGQSADGKTTYPKRADFAIRAMAQTRAMSRAARGPFAFVIVLIDKNISTTPAEEIPEDGHEPLGHGKKTTEAQTADEWREVEIHFGKCKGMKLGDLAEDSIRWWVEKWTPKPDPKTSMLSANDHFLRKALDNAGIELGMTTPPPTK